MVSRFYKTHGTTLLWLVLLSFPFLTIEAETLPSNNDVETWLPQDADVRVAYNDFKAEFGAEEVILIGVSDRRSTDPLVKSLCARIERLPGIRRCWSPERLRKVMRSLGVSPTEIEHRLRGFLVSNDGKLIGLVALLSDTGLKDRAGTVADIRAQLDYCQLNSRDVHLAGSPVVVAELDRLGSRRNNKRYFLITLAISLALLYYAIRRWKLTLSILGLTIWSIQLTLTTIKLIGGEMNFILSALPVMVMIFTLAITIHLLHYFQTSADEPDPLGSALKMAWKPCVLATLTTTIGLISLTISDIAPVRQFGVAASIGSIVAMLTGLGITPAILIRWPHIGSHRSASGRNRFTLFANRLLDHSRAVAIVTGLLVVITGVGVVRIQSKIDPLDFLPKDGKVLSDVRRIENDLTSTTSIEAIVDFGERDQPFVDRLARVRQIESRIASHPEVRHTMSLADFFPTRLPDSSLETASLLNRASGRQGDNDYMTTDQHLWRISIRLKPGTPESRNKVYEELVQSTAGEPIRFTGIAPLLEDAQRAIFDGFWKSFAMAFLIISSVMIISLRSFKLGLVSMIPNVTPICIVFGTLGWINFPVDIGMMMTGSIALGIAVDGTFHFLGRYEERYRKTSDSAQSARSALLQTGAPILEAAVIASLGMMALTLSRFNPTARFGYMMATLLLTAVIGDLILFPAVLSLRPRQKNKPNPAEPPADDQTAASEPILRPHFIRARHTTTHSHKEAS